MWIILGIALGIIYIVQPIDRLRAPVEWMNSALVEYTGTGAEWVLGFFGESEFTAFLALVVAVATPGIAGLILNLIAPLGRMVRVVFAIGITLVSFGAFGTLDWKQAMVFSLVTTVVGGILAIASGPIMEAFAAFFSITLGASQIRMLITEDTSPHLHALINYLEQHAGFLGGDGLQYLAIGIALIPTVLVVLWLLLRLSPVRR